MTIDQLLAELDSQLAARRKRKMGDYKVVPVEPDVPALAEVLTSDLSARINRVSKRSLDGSVVMYSEEWNGIVELVKKLLYTTPQHTERQPAPDVTGGKL